MSDKQHEICETCGCTVGHGCPESEPCLCESEASECWDGMCHECGEEAPIAGSSLCYECDNY